MSVMSFRSRNTPVVSYRTRNFLIAALLGTVAIVLTLVYTAKTRSDNKAAATGSSLVLVATRDIPIGTPGSELAGSGWARSEKVAASALASGAVTAAPQLSTLVAIQPTFRGEQISARRFGTTQQEGLLANLHGTLRVIELPGDANQILAGTLKDGNRVDVVGSLRNPESGTSHFASIALRNLLVVSAADGAPAQSVASQQASVQLLLTTAQAERLFWIEKNADWSLLLRPSIKAKDGAGAPVSSASILEGSNGR
jgi:Flp pilus assembly protein CpaB